MRVRAIAPGYYGQLRAAGEVFDIVDDFAFGSWMEPVDEADAKRLSTHIERFSKGRQLPPPAGVPPTTGPGFHNSLRDPPKPRPRVNEKPPKG